MPRVAVVAKAVGSVVVTGFSKHLGRTQTVLLSGLIGSLKGKGEKRGPQVSLVSAKPQTVNYSCLSEAITVGLGNIWNQLAKRLL